MTPLSRIGSFAHSITLQFSGEPMDQEQKQLRRTGGTPASSVTQTAESLRTQL